MALDGAATEYRVAGLTGTRNLALNSKTLHVSSSAGVSNVYSGALSAGGLRKSGDGTLVLTGGNTLTGVTVDAGVLHVGDGGSTGSLGSGTVTNSASLVIDRAGTLTAANAIGGSGSLTKRGSGTLVLSGISTYTGATTVESGVLRVDGALGASAVSMSSGTTLSGSGSVGGPVTLSATATHAPGTSPGVQTFADGIVYETGSSLVWELVANSVSGRGTSFDGIDVTGGVLNIASGATSTLVFNGAGSAVNWNDAFWAQDRQWVVFDDVNPPALASSRVFDTVTVTADSGGRSLSTARPRAFFRWITDGNDVVLEYRAPRPLLSGATLRVVADDDVSRGVEGVDWEVFGGELYLYDTGGGQEVRISRSDLQAALDSGDVATQVGSIAGDQPLNLSSGRIFTVSHSAASTYDGVLSGAGRLDKSGVGTMTLTAASTLTGGVSIVQGVMVAGSSTAFGTAVVTVSAGATLDLAGRNIDNALNLAGTGVASAGAVTNTGPGGAGLSGAVTLAGPTTLRSPQGLTVGGPISGAHALSIGAAQDHGVTVSATIDVDGPLVITSPRIALDAALNVTGGRVELDSGAPGVGVVTATPTATIDADELLVRNVGDVFLGAPSRMTVATIAATGAGRLRVHNATALTVGTVAGVSGVSTSGRIELSTHDGDLVVTQPITSTVSLSATGVRLSAGTGSPFGVATGGDVTFTGSGTVNAADTIAEIFSGTAAGSAGVGNLATAARVSASAPKVLVGQVAGAYRYGAPVFRSPNAMTVGDSLRLVTTIVTGSAATYVVVSGPCTVDDDILGATSSGSCVVEAVDAAGGSTRQTITVSGRAQQLEFVSAPPVQVVAGTTYTPSVSATSGLPVVVDLVSGDPQACSLANGVVTFTGVGECVIRATQTGDSTFAAASEVRQIVVAGRSNHSITFPVPDDRVVGARPFIVTASAGVGATVTFSATTPTVCAVHADTGRVTVIGAGVCSLTANSTGDPLWTDVTLTRSFRVHARTPGRPTFTSVTVGHGTATVAFVPPSLDGGSPVVGHRLVASPLPDDGSDPVVQDCPAVSPCSIVGLAPGSRYELSLQAYNEAGPGVSASASTHVVPVDTPVAVRDLHSVPDGDVLHLDWQPPSSTDGGTFVRYEVWLRGPDGVWVSTSAITDPDAQSHTVTGLDPNATYDVKIVTVIDRLGVEEAVEAPTALGFALGVPEIPRDLVLTMITPTSFMAAWSAPLGDGGSPIHSYVVLPACVFEQPTDNFCMFVDQPRGVRIEVAVAAVNGFGVGDATTSAITLPALPVNVLPSLIVPSSVERVGGVDRFDTAVRMSRRFFATPSTGEHTPVVYLATARDFADALVAGPSAGLAGGPILLTATDRLPDVTLQEIKRLRPADIVIVGGSAAISADVEESLREAGWPVRRIGGNDRYHTAALLARDWNPGTGGTVYVATGTDFADALSASPAAGAANAPVLLVRPGSIPSATLAELERRQPTRVVIVGGAAAVGSEVESALRQLLPEASVVRIAGADRYRTSALVSAHQFGDTPAVSLLAVGRSFTDALTAAPIATMLGGPVLLVAGNCVPAVVSAELSRLRPVRTVVVGGVATAGFGVVSLTRCP